MKRYLLLLILCSGFATAAQCDLEILDFDPNAATITVAFNNTTSCGGTAGPTGIAELQFGFQAVDDSCNALNQGWDFPWGLSIPDDNNHPGWVYSATTTESPTNWTNLDVWAEYDIDPPYYTGDTVTFPLDDFYQSNSGSLCSTLPDVFDFWLEQDLGIQAVIWQISYGPTMYAEDGGWAEVGANGDGTSYGGGLYEDANFLDNWVQVNCMQQSDYTDGVIDDVEFEVGCIGDEAYYTVDYTVWNYGPDTIWSYCVDFWFQNQIDCYSGYDNPIYWIPPGGGQTATGGPFPFPWYGGGGFFNLSLDSIPGEVITGNNNTTVSLPEMPECPVVADTLIVMLPPDTVIEYVSLDPDTVEIFLVDTLVVTEYDTTYVELPPDTVVITDTIPVPINWYFYDTTYIYVTDTLVEYIELPPDTIVEYDTIPVPINWYFYDTTYIYVTDTLVEYIELPADTVVLYETVIDSVEVYLTDTVELVDYVYLTDTVEVEVVVVEYVVLTDTILDTLYIDCATGLECGELFPEIYNCDDAQLYIPNAFSPNNDGTNDAWKVVYDPTCWKSVSYTIFNRWGEVVYWGYGDEPWDGSVNGGSHYVSDGVYVYTCSARRESDAEIVQESGYITVFR